MTNNCSCSRRRLIGLAGTALAFGAIGGVPGHAKAEPQRLAGKPRLKRLSDGSLSRPGFSATTSDDSAVLRVGPQIFYLDPRTDAEFAEGDDGIVIGIVIKAGGMLSLFSPRAGKGVSVATPNASGAIRGTTTYIAWQESEARTYICCCYGSVEIANSAGGGQLLDTRYHNAIILPSGGGTEPAPYDRPLDHFEDDIAYLEPQVGREPRWQLPTGEMLFLAPDPVTVN